MNLYILYLLIYTQFSDKWLDFTSSRSYN